MDSSNGSLPENFGRYRIRRKLGAGAMGAVYVADDTQLMRPVAIKIPQFPADRSPDLLTRFHLEAQSAAKLRNPHICPVYDFGVIDGQHFISMAYIEGKTLAEVLRSGTAITQRQAVILIRKLALALQDAHQHDIVHRDLKPANIMIDTRGEPVVMDFGLAFQLRLPTARVTAQGQIVGSPAYMSPEQLEGDSKRLTPKVDQFALGVTLYEILTRQLPFQGSFVAIVQQILHQSPPPLKTLVKELDPRIEELCLKLMAKQPDQRYGSMQEVAERCTAILKTEAPRPDDSSEPPSTVETTNHSATYVDGIRERVSSLIENGELREALDVVKEIAALKTPETREWSQQMKQLITGKMQERKRQLSILANVAAKLIRDHDYAEAVNVLSPISPAERTEEIQDLLSDAESKAEETTLLLNEIHEAIANEQPKDLAPLIRRFLQLKPGNAAIRSLADDLKKYGAEEVIRIRRRRQNYFDPAPPLFQTSHVLYTVAGISGLALAVYVWALFYLVPSGTVVVDVHDPRITLEWMKQEITSASSGQRFTLKALDRQWLSAKVDGVEADRREISVANRETKHIVARMLENKLDLQITSDLPSFLPPDKDAASKRETEATNVPPGAVAAIPAATPPADDWIDFMSERDLNARSGKGIRWIRDGEKLIGALTEQADSGVIWKISDRQVAGDFDLELEFLVVGADFLNFGLPLKETVGTLTVAKEGTALHQVDGKVLDWKSNRLPHGTNETRLTPGTRQKLLVFVRHVGKRVVVDAKIDDQPVCQFQGLRSSISTPKVMAPAFNQLKLSSDLSRKPDSRIEIYRYRVRNLGPGQPEPSPEPPASKPTVELKPSTGNPSRSVIDADFTKSNGGFPDLDVEHMLSEHKNGEYRFVGKLVGYWWNGIEPELNKSVNRELDDFTLEFVMRMVGNKGGWFVIRFGLAQREQLSLCIDNTGKIRLLRGFDAELVPPTLPRTLKPLDQWNTVQLSVEKKTVRVKVNGEPVFDKRLEQYVGGSVRIWLAPDEVPFDVRLQRYRLETPVITAPRPPSQELRKFAGHLEPIRGIQFLPGGEEAISVSDDKTIRIWNVASGKLLKTIDGHPAAVTSVSVSDDGRRALTGCADGLVRLWDLETREAIKILKGHSRTIAQVALSGDAKKAWAAADDGSIRAWDLKTSAGSKLIAAPGTGTTIKVSSTGRVIAAGNDLGQVHVQSAASGCTLVGHSSGAITGIAFSPDDRKLVTASDDGTLRLWDLETCAETHYFPGEGASFTSVALTNDGRYAIAGNIDRRIYQFDLQTGDIVRELRADRAVNQILALSPDNKLIVSAGDGDHDLHLWQLSGPVK